MSEATLSVAVAALASAVGALARGDTEAVNAELNQVDAALQKAADEREAEPADLAKSMAEGLEKLSQITAHRIMDEQKRRG